MSVAVLLSVCSVQMAPAQAWHVSQHWDSFLAGGSQARKHTHVELA